MKRICVIVLSAIITFTICFPMSVAAASNKYDMPELGLEVTIPDGYAVITRDTPDNDPIFNDLGITKTAIISQFEASSIYLNAISNSSNEEILVTMAENMIDNFSLFSDTTLDVLAATVVGQYSDYGIDVIEYEIYHHSQAKFIKIYFTDAAKTVYGLQYYTVYDSKAINFTMRSYEGSISSRQEMTIKTTVDSVLFDNAPPAVEQGEDTNPFQYNDNGSGVTFTVPANWQQEAFTEDRELIDVKFVSTKEKGSSIIYGSVDMWEAMSATDRIGYTRSDINNSAFTKAEVAEIYGITADEISMVTYNEVQYFKGEVNTVADAYGIDIAVTMTQLICIENGWMYMFQFHGTSTHKLYSDFEKLINSVKYPTTPTAEETETTKPTASDVEKPEPTKPTTTVPDHTKQNSSHTSENNSGVIVAVVLLVGVLLAVVSVIVVAVVIACKKKTKTLNHPDDPISANDPVTKPVIDTEQVLTCKKCGQTLPSDSVFCHMCGTKIDRELRL